MNENGQCGGLEEKNGLLWPQGKTWSSVLEMPELISGPSLPLHTVVINGNYNKLDIICKGRYRYRIQ